MCIMKNKKLCMNSLHLLKNKYDVNDENVKKAFQILQDLVDKQPNDKIGLSEDIYYGKCFDDEIIGQKGNFAVVICPVKVKGYKQILYAALLNKPCEFASEKKYLEYLGNLSYERQIVFPLISELMTVFDDKADDIAHALAFSRLSSAVVKPKGFDWGYTVDENDAIVPLQKVVKHKSDDGVFRIRQVCFVDRYFNLQRIKMPKQIEILNW